MSRGRLATTSSISIHAPREGSDNIILLGTGAVHGFQSTLPARGATRMTSPKTSDTTDFNPRSPRGERHSGKLAYASGIYFNPRSPRGERHKYYCDTHHHNLFQSTLPARGATPILPPGQPCRRISIHAPREGSDHTILYCRAPGRTFQSTLPARGATECVSLPGDYCNISIHAPREGSDTVVG